MSKGAGAAASGTPSPLLSTVSAAHAKTIHGHNACIKIAKLSEIIGAATNNYGDNSHEFPYDFPNKIALSPDLRSILIRSGEGYKIFELGKDGHLEGEGEGVFYKKDIFYLNHSSEDTEEKAKLRKEITRDIEEIAVKKGKVREFITAIAENGGSEIEC